MKKKLILAFLLGPVTSMAGYNFPIVSEGDVHIERDAQVTTEFLTDVKDPVSEAIKSQCENSPKMIGGGAFSRITSINLDPVQKTITGHGYTVHYLVFGRCEIP